MKKTILIGASVFALMATPAFAQVGSEVDQDGNGNDATVSQNATGFTDSYVTQVGDNNEADVTQTGDNNNSTIEQTSADADPSNQATVTQAGANDDATVIQSGENIAAVNQGVDAASLNDDAFILQIGASTATVNQNGQDQVAGIGQFGVDNEATITQNGQGSGLDLGTIANDFVNETVAGAVIAQIGDDSTASITQTETSIDGGSLIVQLSGNEAHNTQSGDSAFSEIYQFGGSDNFANVEQGGVDADSFVVQNGSGNEALVGQDGGTSFVSQAGNGNVAHVTQGGASLPAGVGGGI